VRPLLLAANGREGAADPTGVKRHHAGGEVVTQGRRTALVERAAGPEDLVGGEVEGVKREAEDLAPDQREEAMGAVLGPLEQDGAAARSKPARSPWRSIWRRTLRTSSRVAGE
jgi:hypothetical protein